MPQTATLTPVATKMFTVSIKTPMTLNQLLDAAGIKNYRKIAQFFWELTNRTNERSVILHGVEVQFFSCSQNEEHLSEFMQATLMEATMKAITAYELFCFAACNPKQFRALLKELPIVVANHGNRPFLFISLNAGKIRLQEIDLASHLGNFFFAGASLI